MIEIPRQIIIWKKEECKKGECKGISEMHEWSVPFSTPSGLACECLRCNKIKFVKIEK